MNFNRLKAFRQQAYKSLEREANALFNLCDALLSETTAGSVPELSLSPHFQRRWSSIYQALKRGRMNVASLREAWVKALMDEYAEQQTVWISVDSSSIPRPEADKSRDRGIIYVPNMPRATKPVSVGWQFSTVMLLPEEPSSWVGILDQQRIGTSQTAIGVAIQQLQILVPLLKRPVVVLADRWYATGEFLQACQQLGCQVLIRLKRNRKLYHAPVRKNGKGRPPLDGPLFQGSRPETLGGSEAAWEGQDEKGKLISVTRWTGLHFRQARTLSVTVVRVVRAGAKGSKRDPRESWFVLLGSDVPLHQMAQVYARRFSHEHGYRFLKQDLLWTQAHVRTPEQFERWSIVVALAMNQLKLSRSLGQARYRPWECLSRQATPRQVRRVMSAILWQVGTPVARCQPRGKSPGRAIGFHPQPALRYDVVIKHPKKGVSDSH